jgi:hypothetical protein
MEPPRIGRLALATIIFCLIANGSLAADLGPQGATVLWHPGARAEELSAAHIIRIAPGFHNSDLKLLRDDQLIQTPSGRTVRVGFLRAVQKTVAAANNARLTRVHADSFAILPQPKSPCDQLRAGVGLQQILVRPDSDVVCFPSGRRTTVAQIRAMIPYLQRTQHLNVTGATTEQRVNINVTPIVIHTSAELTSELNGPLRNSPDSTVLATPQGHQVTLGQLRSVLGAAARQRGLVPVTPQNGGAK